MGQTSSVLDVRKLPEGMLLYRRSYGACDEDKLCTMHIAWFALTPDYGEGTYGDTTTVWEVRRDTWLLELNTIDQRKRIVAASGIDADVLDPDEQYSGGRGNLATHLALKPVIDEKGLAGTYVNAEEADDEVAGATEVVLYDATAYVQLHNP